MTTWFVTRHPGAIAWAARRGLAVDRCIAHLDPETVAPGDTVIGVLPVNLAARVCERGGRYFNLSLDLPPEARGRELSADELETYGARLEGFEIRRSNPAAHARK
jgi:CRISPR-associated protein Csx16